MRTRYIDRIAAADQRPGAADREFTSGDTRMGPKSRCKCGAMVYRRFMRGGKCYECFLRGVSRKGAT